MRSVRLGPKIDMHARGGEREGRQTKREREEMERDTDVIRRYNTSSHTPLHLSSVMKKRVSMQAVRDARCMKRERDCERSGRKSGRLTWNERGRLASKPSPLMSQTCTTASPKTLTIHKHALKRRELRTLFLRRDNDRGVG